MTAEEISKKLDELEQELTKANARADKAEAELLIAKLDGEDREAFNALPSEDQQAFHAASEEQRSEMLEKGRKSISKRDEMPEEIAKKFEEITKKLKEAEDRAAVAETVAKKAADERHLIELSKRASEEFAGLPGTNIEKAYVLKSLEKLTDAERTEVEKMLKAGNECLKGQMKPVGKSASESGDSAESVIEKRAQAIASEKGVSVAKATEMYLDTQEGRETYSRLLEEKRR